MSLLRSFIQRLENASLAAPSVADEPEPMPPLLAAAEAAIEEAIRQRQSLDRRDPFRADRRDSDRVAVRPDGPDRRGPIADRRKPKDFGRRTRN